MINTSRINYKIFLTVASVFFILFALSGLASYFLVDNLLKTHLDLYLEKTGHGIRQTIEASARLSSRSYLQAIADRCLQTAGFYYNSVQTTDRDISRAKQQAISVFDSIEIGRSGYVYIIDSQGVVQSHPSPSLEEKDVSDQAFVAEQIRRKTGYLEYRWKNPEDKKARPKLLYMEYFQPWDWIISVSAYREELPQLVNFADFKELVAGNRLLDNGSLYILDEKGDTLLHSTARQGTIDHDQTLQRLHKAIGENPQARRVVLRPDEMQKNLVVFERISDFDWIVAVAVEIEEFYQPREMVRNLHIALLLLSLFISLIISYYLTASITSPFTSLLARLSQNSKKLALQQSIPPHADELEQISHYFSEYIRAIEHSNDQLQVMMEQQRRISLDLDIYRQVFENLAEGISITDTEGTIVRINPAFEKITGYSAEEAEGQTPRILKSDRHPPSFYEEMWQRISKRGYWSGEIWNRRKNGEIYPEWLTISAVKDDEGITCYYAAAFNDITDLVEQQEKVRFLAYHDHLTELPNRIMIRERMGELLSECRRADTKLLCLICDIVDFKAVNDSLGQENGDALLKLFVERIHPLTRKEDTLGRIGGDEFVFLAKSTNGAEQALTITQRLFSACKQPFRIDEQDIYVNLSIGIALFPDDADNEDELLKRSILAQNTAEKEKGNSYRYYNPEMEKKVTRKIHYLAKIRDGLKNNEFTPFYQPKILLATGQVLGMEALARWQSGNKLVSPGEFIPVAEDSGLINEMSQQLYVKAFKDCARLLDMNHSLKLSVNLSPIQLYSEDFLEKFLHMQQQSGLSPKNIELEVTESVLFENIEHTRDIIEELTGRGFSISIDDFGTGYSSLQYLKQISFDTLKIDMSFVSGIGKDYDDEQLVRTISLLAKQFGMQIVAEGVETAEHVRFLGALGCDFGQGYYYSRPLPFDDFIKWLNNYRSG